MGRSLELTGHQSSQNSELQGQQDPILKKKKRWEVMKEYTQCQPLAYVHTYACTLACAYIHTHHIHTKSMLPLHLAHFCLHLSLQRAYLQSGSLSYPQQKQGWFT